MPPGIFSIHFPGVDISLSPDIFLQYFTRTFPQDIFLAPLISYPVHKINIHIGVTLSVVIVGYDPNLLLPLSHEFLHQPVFYLSKIRFVYPGWIAFYFIGRNSFIDQASS